MLCMSNIPMITKFNAIAYSTSKQSRCPIADADASSWLRARFHEWKRACTPHVLPFSVESLLNHILKPSSVLFTRCMQDVLPARFAIVSKANWRPSLSCDAVATLNVEH